jgi:multicomponent Na+:H+ antiporter subunit E
MLRAAVLFMVLLLLWLLLSGIYEPLLLGLGIASCAFVVWIALRKDVLDAEGLPMHLHLGRSLHYAAWLAWQVFLSTLDVTWRIWHPALPISPGVRHVPAELGDVARVIYANSITLTPGTVSIDVDADRILVHSLTEEGLAGLEAGEMYRRVKHLEE